MSDERPSLKHIRRLYIDITRCAHCAAVSTAHVDVVILAAAPVALM